MSRTLFVALTVLLCAAVYVGFKLVKASRARARAAERNNSPTLFADGAPETVPDTLIPPETIPAALR